VYLGFHKTYPLFYSDFNPVRMKLDVSDLMIQVVPRRKHSASVLKTDKLTSHREMIVVCSEIHKKHIHIVGRIQSY